MTAQTSTQSSKSNSSSLRTRLLIGASIGAMLLTGVAEAQDRSGGGRVFGGRGGGDPTAAAARAAQDQATRANETNSATQRAITAFRRAAETRQAMNDAQIAARNAARQVQSTVPNGLGQGGLQVANGVELDPNLWVGANGPVQSEGENGRTNVTVEQTQQQAILNWDSFNVGRETDLRFNQGGADWVALNRVVGNSADPSQILGSIKAQGTVLILNQNGVIFGGASQVNVRNLIASSANITDAHFLDRGIYSALSGANYVPSFTNAGGAITVEAGAQITTNTPESVTSGGGYVLLMGTEVRNEGAITTPRGQTTLSAGDNFIIRRGYGTEENLYSTTRGNEVRGLINADSTSGTVTNAGLIEAAQGDITLAGRTIRQDGVMVSTTSVNQRGTIHLLNSATDGEGSVTLGADSLTIILPELDSEDTALNGQRDALIAESAIANTQRASTTNGGFNDRSLLADRLDQSRIEIVTGGDVVFEGGSQTSAQGGQVAVQANNGRITVEDGARIDVSGVMGVALDMEDNSIKVNIQGNEMRDSPANRDAETIRSQDVWIDVRDLILLPDGTGGYEGDRWYTPGGLLEVGGHLQNMAHGIGEWAAVGGTITLSASEIVAQQGAVFDISGGSLDYRSGYVRSTRVMGADGRMYDIRNAPAHITMVAVGNAFMRKHDRWGEMYTEVYSDPLFSRGTSMRWENGYTVGRDAGRLILSAPTIIMEADIEAEVINGARQTNARADGVTDGYKLGQHTVAQAGSLVLGRYAQRGLEGVFGTDVRVSDVDGVTGDLSVPGELPEDRINTAWFDAAHLNAQGLGGLILRTSGDITIDAPLQLADGGRLEMIAPVIDIDADITVRAGSISATNILVTDVPTATPTGLLNDGIASVTLREGANLDLRGHWTSLLSDPNDASKLGFLNGGRVSLASTHGVSFETGSSIDVSSGGAVLTDGSIRGGRGGDVSLLANQRTSNVENSNGVLTYDGDIRAYGMSGGGTLQLDSGTAIIVGGEALETNGQLTAGEEAPTNLVLGEDVLLAVGEITPIDLTISRSSLRAGDTVPVPIQFTNTGHTLNIVVGPGGWDLTGTNMDVYVSGSNTAANRYRGNTGPRQVVPEGAVITRINGGTLPAGFVIRAGALVGEIPTPSYNAPVPAGSPVPQDMLIGSGTILPAGTVMNRSVSVALMPHLGAEDFRTGFSDYRINGHQGLLVVDNAQIDVEMPVYRATARALQTATGAAPSDALELWTPPTYLEDPLSGTLTQRAGARLELRSTRNAGQRTVGGPIEVGKGAVITVDPRQEIAIAAGFGSQVTIDGRLNAWGGAITIDTARVVNSANALVSPSSIWIGENAHLDVAGRTALAIDRQGRRYGRVDAGGMISIGGALDWESSGEADAANTFIVIRPGAVLDASGTHATIDIPLGLPQGGARATEVASNGGAIILKSTNGLFLDGDMRANAGGQGAAGGTLAIALETPNYSTGQVIGDALRTPREFILSQGRSEFSDIEDSTPGDARFTGLYGRGRVSVEEINAGGFDNLALLVNGVLSFDGDVSLALGESVRLYAGSYALAEGASTTAKINLTAPYVRLASSTRTALDNHVMPTVWRGVSTQDSEALFSVAGSLLDVRDAVWFGANGSVARAAGGPIVVDRAGFGTVDLRSTGDLRFLKGRAAVGAGAPTTLQTTGDLNLFASRLYPETGADVLINAGYETADTSNPDKVLTIGRPEGESVLPPPSLFGRIRLGAETILQGGALFAPLGLIELFSPSQMSAPVSGEIRLLPGSITSVSAAGLTMPYGGTIEGLTYEYDGSEVSLIGAGGLGGLTNPVGVRLSANSINVEENAVLDMSGGGDVLGAGFISGRGGSVNVLHHALSTANPAYSLSDSGGAVYAIVPGFAGDYAPVASSESAGDLSIGRQISIGDGVPGLPAGTYTLLPSAYALMPGAFRVEIGSAGAGAHRPSQAVPGTYATTGVMSVANTAISEALPTQILVTSGEAVRGHSQFNEMSYSEFVLANAQRMGIPRSMLPADAKPLELVFGFGAGRGETPALQVDGIARFGAEPDSNGRAGTLIVRGSAIEILAEGAAPTADFFGQGGLDAVSLYAEDINALSPGRMIIGGGLEYLPGEDQTYSSRLAYRATADQVVVRNGAELRAPEIVLLAQYHLAGDSGGDVIVEQGAVLSTLGQGAAPWDSSDGFYYVPFGSNSTGEASVFVVSNGWVNLLGGNGDPSGSITIGACATNSCETTSIYSEGTIAAATNGVFSLGENVEYGTRNLVLGVASINLGEDSALAEAQAAGQLPGGLNFNQRRLEQLLAGNTAIGAPALETLVLNASGAVNTFGSVSLDTLNPETGVSSLERLVFGTPAIYGYGGAEDVVTIRTGELIWAGTNEAAGAPVTSLLGDSVLDIQAEHILFGYAPTSQPSNITTDNRIALGFAEVRLTASERIASAGEGSLDVYHRRSAWSKEDGYAYEGGNLTITTPVMTGEAGSRNTITAGGDIRVTGSGEYDAIDALGATLAFNGRNIVVDTAVVLPSGRLSLSATGDVTLGDNATVDLAGRAVEMFDVTKYSWGGDLLLASTNGSITSAVGSTIDVSAEQNRGGAVDITALGDGGGHVALAGGILGAATGEYDAGGTVVPYDGAELTIRAQTLADFDGLNALLNDGGVFGARRFQLRQGDLIVGDGVKAREVQIVLDGGDLTVNGTIDASGYQVGTIRLAAMGDLTINGTLDAHGRGLRVDSYGKIIDSPNRAIVDLTSREGVLTLSNNATIDLRAGTEVAQGNGSGQNDGRARGTLDLNARRVGANDVAINIGGAPSIEGAKTVAVNAFRTYDDAPLANLPDVSGARPQLITQAYLDVIDGHSQTFINAALGNGDLSGRLSGLGEYHLRPGVELVANAALNPEGHLTVSGDIDLSDYRYGPDANRVDPALRGYGEPGVLVIRSAGNLTILGSINDGFAPPPETPDDANGWNLNVGAVPFGGKAVVQRDGVVLDTGTVFQANATLNFDAPVNGITLPAGTVLPTGVVLAGSYRLPAGSVVASDIHNSDGTLAYAAGTVVGTDVVLSAGTRLGAGMVLRTGASISGLIWPKGVRMPVAMTLSGPLTLAVGSVIPQLTDVRLPNGDPIGLRDSVDGSQGRNWAVAPMLGSGATAWNMNLVGGADMLSADNRQVRRDGIGSVSLGDSHQIVDTKLETVRWFNWASGQSIRPPGTPVAPADLFYCDIVPAWCVLTREEERVVASPYAAGFSVVRTGTGDLTLHAAADIRMESPFGVYTAGRPTTLGAADAEFDRPRGMLPDGSAMGPHSEDYVASLGAWRAWYPDHGGNLTLRAGGNLLGDVWAPNYGSSPQRTPSASVGNWLWRQGTGTAINGDASIPTAWWINFGSYGWPAGRTMNSTTVPNRPYLVGFTGIGALGGGNVDIDVRGNAGIIDRHPANYNNYGRSQAVVVAVGSTGRVLDGQLLQTGGGDIALRIGGDLNPYAHAYEVSHSLNGALVNLRGAMHLQAGSVGSMLLDFMPALGAPLPELGDEVRVRDPLLPRWAVPKGGPILVLGDSAAYLNARDDLILGAAADPGRVGTYHSTSFAADGATYDGGGISWFSLWSPATAVNLFAAGGDLTPITIQSDMAHIYNRQEGLDGSFTDGRYVYPSILRAVAASGNMYYGRTGVGRQGGNARVAQDLQVSLILAPSPAGALELLAGQSLYAGGYAINMSGSDTPLPTPFNPAFTGTIGGGGQIVVSNLSLEGILPSPSSGRFPLFTFGPNTISLRPIHEGMSDPARFYAVEGDIIGLRTGERLTWASAGRTWYEAATPVWVQAGRDIVNVGTGPGGATEVPSAARHGYRWTTGARSEGNLIVHNDPNDISIVSAGRDILYANFMVAGPGTLEISAGRNITQEDRGAITSIGPIAPGDNRPGASIAMMAGMGNGVNWTAIRDLYLDPANLADPDRPLGEQNGIDDDGFVTEARVAPKNYGEELVDWLEGRYGFAGTSEDALAYFDALAPEHQRIFLREVYYAETREGGREYNDADGPRFGSYLRGRLAIAALFPDRDAEGNEIERPGDIVMFSSEYFEGTGANRVRRTRDGAVRTNFGGDIELMAPGGQIIVGVQGLVPGAASGLVTQGAGDIRLFSEQSILLGLSRILTTFGGDIFAWSEEGDINAGRGAKTTVLYTPPLRTYDAYGNVRLAPQVPSSGAGIGTLNPIPEVEPGDIDLVAPLGTIDAGEAGIRVSGNINLAALQVLNAANIQVQGEAAGIPMAVVVNTGALTAASGATTAVANQAAQLAERARPEPIRDLPSLITGRLLGFGE